jgi:amino acid transporter
MIVAVLGGTLASLQAAIVSSSRISFAMGRDRVFPHWFGVISEKHRTPWNATILLGLLNVVFLWASTLIGPIGQALGDIVDTLGLMAATGKSSFYTDPTHSHGDLVEQELAGPATA